MRQIRSVLLAMIVAGSFSLLVGWMILVPIWLFICGAVFGNEGYIYLLDDRRAIAIGSVVGSMCAGLFWHKVGLTMTWEDLSAALCAPSFILGSVLTTFIPWAVTHIIALVRRLSMFRNPKFCVLLLLFLVAFVIGCGGEKKKTDSADKVPHYHMLADTLHWSIPAAGIGIIQVGEDEHSSIIPAFVRLPFKPIKGGAVKIIGLYASGIIPGFGTSVTLVQIADSTTVWDNEPIRGKKDFFGPAVLTIAPEDMYQLPERQRLYKLSHPDSDTIHQ